jgi:hypothetical protein
VPVQVPRVLLAQQTGANPACRPLGMIHGRRNVYFPMLLYAMQPAVNGFVVTRPDAIFLACLPTSPR